MRWSPLWAGVLIVALLWPLALPGQLALRDMLVLDSPALSPGALGTGDLPARNAPQDGLLALLGTVLPASWVARGLILAGAVAGAVGAVWLARFQGATRLSTLASLTLVLWNPFVVERLLQGHWSLVIAGWLLPLIAVAGMSGRPGVAWVAMWAASLTPTGALFALFTGVATARAHRGRTLLLGVLCCLPWLVPGLIHSGGAVAESAAAFAPRAEGYVGAPGALVGLGGIWNADAVPPSREIGFALAGVLLFALLLTAARRVPAPLLWLAGVGLGGAVFAWLAPGVLGWLIATVPGAGLVRDASKLTVLALPAYVAAAASTRTWAAGLVLVLALLQVPDAPRALAPLSPQPVAVDRSLVDLVDGRDVLLVDEPTLVRRADGIVMINPLAKALPTVESGALSVDGVLVDAPSPRWRSAIAAWEARDMAALEDLGVGVVVSEGQVVETAAGPQPRRLGLTLLAVWLLIPAGVWLARWR
ncbi:hypothetical protein [Corynebacterium comes]|uniref:Glycosyltransferase RgtA/B/C/D-like domain-containing protein n=1 Tax=Corynebacterium comes TaxID=2675218 RepID=A0A6B8W6V8_9CORY|nr:hypothetical protein [Corynebacterium comes]QGU05690.1 hypothetical protein CETAM_12295 [Corynebacterium comes]